MRVQYYDGKVQRVILLKKIVVEVEEFEIQHFNSYLHSSSFAGKLKAGKLTVEKIQCQA